ncbi:hypothetical protein [Minwuia thermotolerans]|uniref:hypothetical protein n=1 Tax=Minwuia thermotolerans TaxID=2056226 RepID=UPI0019D23BB9|nr:hypothetical protein [Minwuia thermotolerans]
MKQWLAAGLVAASVGFPAHAGEPFSFVALGDMPYNLPADYAKFDRLVERINAEGPAFSIHIGDIKSGAWPCDDATFQAIRDRFDAFDAPLFYTPGDNEWTDCHRAAAGGFDPLERLSAVRRMFFAAAESHGRASKSYRRQSDLSPEHGEMVENAIWRHQDVLFATVHVVSSNNGLERSPAAVAEFLARDAANLDWIARAFREAAETDARAVVVAMHANPIFEAEKPWDYANSGFKRTITALSAGASAFGRPVLIVHGDFHTFRLDQPLKGPDGKVLKQVWRLEVMGASDVHAVEVEVRPEDPGVFAFRPLIVAGNLD